MTFILTNYTLQDWQNLVQKYEEVFPKAELVEIMSSQGRTMAPLISGEQQKQISATKLQHASRLQSQKQLTESLLRMLATAGKAPTPVQSLKDILQCIGNMTAL